MDVQEQYERSSDTVKAFLEECTETDGNSNVPKSELWKAFEEYCKKYNVPLSFTKRTFGSKMRETNTETNTTIDGQSVRVWLGLKLRNYATTVLSTSSEYSENNKSIKESKEKGKMRSTVADKKLDDVFKK